MFANEKLLQYIMEYVISCRLSPLESRRVAYTPIPFWLTIRIRIRIVMGPSIVYIDNVLSHMPPEATGSTSSSNLPQIRIQIVLFKIIILPGACFHAPAIS